MVRSFRTEQIIHWWLFSMTVHFLSFVLVDNVAGGGYEMDSFHLDSQCRPPGTVCVRNLQIKLRPR